MASDVDFNRKSFTTGHTGYGVPFLTQPDRADTPRNAARALRYMDRYVTVTQGEVFYITELLSRIEGLERGAAGNTSLAAAAGLAREMDEDQIVVVQETEYTAAGKIHSAQLTFARENGVQVRRGDPRENIPGKVIVIPECLEQLIPEEYDLQKARRSYVKNIVQGLPGYTPTEADLVFLAEETMSSVAFIREILEEMSAGQG